MTRAPRDVPGGVTSAGGRAWDWLGAHDPGYGALRRAVRVAILMPALLAVGTQLIDNATLATFAAFGAISTMLLVDFRGTIRDRVQSQAALVLTGAALTCLGTLASRSVVAASLGMAVVGVAILFSSVVSSVLAGATTSLLLGFILPVSLPGPISSIPDRLAGWGMAGGVSLLAISLLWPAPAVDPLRDAASACCRALAGALRGQIAGEDRSGPAHETLEALGRVFLGTPYRPTGLTTAARAGVRLVDELRWLGEIVLGSRAPRAGVGVGAPEVDGVRDAAAAVLEHGADVLADPSGPTADLAAARARLGVAVRALEDGVCVPSVGVLAAGDGEAEVDAFISSLDPAFRAQETSFMTDQVAQNIEAVAVASSRSWLARALGRQPLGLGGRLSSVRERAAAHLQPRSVALHNSLRGGVGLGLAVLVARLIGVEHAFWVSFGTLSVLRSNALSTGQTFARALAGTVAGFVIGAALVLAIGTDTTVLWVLLPIALLIGGVAPAAISFAAGQAGFTVVLFILFNILTLAGWRVGLVRIEDVALGGAASLIVGLLFWPRGAGAALGRALGDAYTESARYLSSAVDFAVLCCAPGMPGAGDGQRNGASAAAASRRLDDTFRTFLVERGPKRLGLAEVTTLVNGTTALRLAGDAILALWRDDDEPTQSRIAAARELLRRARGAEAWYGRFVAGLLESGPLPEPDPLDPVADERLVATIDHDLRSADGSATGAAVRIMWTGDHIDAARRMEAVLVGPAREAVHHGTLHVGSPRRALRATRPAAERVPRPQAE